jgi:sulfatase modifying factor 1
MTARILLMILLLSGEVTIAQKKLTNCVGMDFVLIEPGTFVVGEFKPPYPVPGDTVKSVTMRKNLD